MCVPRNAIPFDHGALKRWRIERELTQAELAREIGLAREISISDWERTKTPTLATVKKLAEVLRVPINDLLVPAEDDQRDLRRLRIEAGLDVGQAAEQLEMLKATYSSWEEKKVVALIEKADVERIATVFNVTVETAVKAVVLSSRAARYANWPFGP